MIKTACKSRNCTCCPLSVEKTKIRQSLLFVTQSQPQQQQQQQPTATATTFTKEVKKRKNVKEQQHIKKSHQKPQLDLEIFLN